MTRLKMIVLYRKNLKIKCSDISKSYSNICYNQFELQFNFKLTNENKSPGAFVLLPQFSALTLCEPYNFKTLIFFFFISANLLIRNNISNFIAILRVSTSEFFDI